MKNIIFLPGLSFLFVLVSCSSQTTLSSINFDACFKNYKDPAELTKSLNELNEVLDSDNPGTPFMTVAGCLNYQLGNNSVSEQWLTRAFQQATDKKTKNIAASALGLIYLREMQTDKIVKDYTDSAKQHPLGRWMMVLYNLAYYRDTGHGQYLLSAIREMESKHEVEGETTATVRFLDHMRLIGQMEEICGVPENPNCSLADLDGEKRYLFSTSDGFLSMLLKRPPLNRISI